jgi:uncharacterized protein
MGKQYLSIRKWYRADMHVAQLWRYPVKSLRGEPLSSARLSENGVEGDRLVHVASPRGVVTARTRHALLGLAGKTASDGTILVDGLPWDHPISARKVRGAAGEQAYLAAYDGRERFDVLPLLVATDGAISALGTDGRRLRPNLVIGGVSGLDERSWPGRALRIGEVLIGMESLRPRCVVTTIDPDTAEQDVDVLKTINREFEGKVALNCWVAMPGRVRLGDTVGLVEVSLAPPKRGGWILGAPYVHS